ncbi:MAG: universal stress protein [Dehalococcoidia bacterium]
MYRKILLTLDGSDLSQQALPHAVELAKATAAPLVVMQVTDSEAQLIVQTAGPTIEPMAAGHVSADIARDAVVAQRRDADANLEAVRERIVAAGVTDVTTEVREGSAGAAIVEAAEELGCDLIVMATSGRSGLKRAVLGSVADHVVRNSPDSAVLLVRATEE